MVTEVEVEELTLAFRGLSDGSDQDSDEEVGGGSIGDDVKPKSREDGDDPLLEEDPLDAELDDKDDDDLEDDGTPDM